MEVSANTFQHFWEDGIVESGDLATEKSIRRRKILIATSDTLVSNPPATGKKIAESSLIRDVTAPESDLREFASRKVLTYKSQNDSYNFKVRLFHSWLKDRGIHELIATFSDLNTALRTRQQEEAQRVQATEVVDLVERFGTYKGQSITEDKVRAWLHQFGTPKNQRVMFKILQNLRFYSNGVIREKMKEVDNIVRRGMTRHLERGKLKRSDIAVSYLDKPGKSGAHFARLYADEASIYVNNVIEQAKLSEFLTQNPDIQALVFVDDFVGTGNSAVEYLQVIDQEFGSVIKERKTKVVFVAVVSYMNGWKYIQETVKKLGIPVIIHTCEMLDDTYKCFGESSIVFGDPDERDFAREIARTQGKSLEKKWPLGYGDLELAIVFEHGCPNNSLPILWAESTGQKRWRPLFKRL
ncbi:MAG: hypothetical protein KDJ65_02345 [Anaerolineae bacterium]|nr:hypothetical protein [Anaerolineae bacterium]